MAPQTIIAASILAANFAELGKDIRQAEAAGADWIHVDIMDGCFVPEITMGSMIVQTVRQETRLPLDVHLMIVQPERHLESFASAGASGITVHLETCPHIHSTLQTIRQLGCKAGVVINPGTPATGLESILHMVDLILIMSVNPGFGGQSFIPEVLPKIIQVRQMLNEIQSSAWLEVDGGIDPETLIQTYQAGARAFVSGTAIFRHPKGIKAGIQSLRSAIPVLK